MSGAGVLNGRKAGPLTGRSGRSGTARLISLVVTVALAGAAAACTADEEPDPEESLRGLVNVGVNTDVPGFSEYTPGGVWQGFDISLIRWLAEDIGFTPQFVPMTVEERMTKLIEASKEPKTAAVSMVVANFSMDDGRRKFIDMVGPYFLDAQGFLTSSGSRLETLTDFDDKLVCVTRGSTNEGRIPETRAIAVPAATLTQCVQDLKENKVKGISSDIVLLEGLRHQHEDLRLTGIRFGSELYGIGIPNGRPKLCEFLKIRLKRFIDNEWEQKIKDNLAYIQTGDRKPNSDALTPCENPDSKAASSNYGAAILTDAARRVTQGRRDGVRSISSRGRRRKPSRGAPHPTAVAAVE